MPWTKILVPGLTRIDMRDTHSFYHRFRGVCHRTAAEDSQAGFGEGLFAGLDVVAFEANDQREFEAGFFNGGDDAGGDHIAVHDAAEDVDQNTLHMRVLEDDFEGGCDLLLASAAANVEEVGGAAAEVLDDVHGGHRQSGAIDQAGDRSEEHTSELQSRLHLVCR